MHFAVRKRRQSPAVIIVALIDVLVVLVIFLVVTTTFKQQPALKITLPQSTQAKKAGANENPPTIVFIAANGDLRLGNEATPVTSDRLRQELQQLSAGKTNFTVALSADEKAPVGQAVRVMDIVRELGIRAVSLYAKEPGK